METEENIVEKHRNCLERQRTKQPSSSKRLWPAGGRVGSSLSFHA